MVGSGIYLGDTDHRVREGLGVGKRKSESWRTAVAAVGDWERCREHWLLS